MKKANINFTKAQQYLSHARLGRYLAATNNDYVRAISLYEENLKIASCFHPLLGTLEVVLRNRLDDVLANYFGDPSWILHQRKGFMSDPSLVYIDKRTGQITTDDFLKKSVETTEKRFRKLGIPVTASRIIADQNFSFWTEIFQLKYYRILKGRPIQTFPFLPSGFGRQQVLDALTLVRLFRNRINHNESICFIENAIDFTAAREVHKNILALFSWIDKDLQAWVAGFDQVSHAIQTAEAV